MKKVYFLLVALSIWLLEIDVNAQTYKPCLNYRTTIRAYTGTEWQDAFIDSFTKVKVSHRNSKNADIITREFREDNEGRIYEKITTESGTSIERLTVDMTLVRGDKFTFYEDEEAISVVDIYVKDGRKTIVFDKKIEYQSGDDYSGEPFVVVDSIKFIEGIGCNMGLLYRYQLDDGRYNQLMSCKYDNGNMIYEINDTHFSHCNIVRKDKESYEPIFGQKSTKYSVFVPLIMDKKVGSTIDYDDADNAMGIAGECLMSTTGLTENFCILNINDTSFNGITYKFQKDNNYCDYYLREDTITGQIFRYFPECNKEFITCDMSIGVGDTFILPNMSDCVELYMEEGFNLVVDSVRYTNDKKHIYFKPIDCDPFYSEFYDIGSYNTWGRHYGVMLKFIEGVGPIYSPMGHIRIAQPYLGVLLCVEKDEKLYYMTSELLGCEQKYVSVTNPIEELIYIYPNPVINEMTIKCDENKDYSIVITDILGRIVYRDNVSGDIFNLNVSQLPAAVYTVVLTSKESKIVSKFIKSK